VDEIVQPNPALVDVAVHKHRTHYRLSGCQAELSQVSAGRRSARTIAVEAEDPVLVAAAVRSLHLADRPNVCLARGLKTLVGFDPVRFAVIDVGTNSVKLHVGERRAGDAWRTIVDRAEVTRLGEGLDETGELQPEPIRRTADAVVAWSTSRGTSAPRRSPRSRPPGCGSRPTPPSSSTRCRSAAGSESR
jgi:Exopolyphosphatase